MNFISWVRCRRMCRFSRAVVWPSVIFVLDGEWAGSLCTIAIICLKVLSLQMLEATSSFEFDIESVRPGLFDLSSRILGPSSVIQAALSDILSNTPKKYVYDIMNQIQVINNFSFSLTCDISSIVYRWMPSPAVKFWVKHPVWSRWCLKERCTCW